MKLISHRGLWYNKKEQNTINSFINAINSEKYVGFECDIRESKDKKYIINHNAFIKDSLIKKTNLEDLKSYNNPTLFDVLNLKTDKIKLIEIKDININIEKLNEILNKYSNDKIYVMSFHNSVIEKLYKKKHNYKLGILNYILNSDDKYKYDFVCLLDNLTSLEKINKFLNNNIEVFIYGIFAKKMNYENKVYYIIDDNQL